MSAGDAPVLVTTTAPSMESAEKIARALLERKLAACVQLVHPIRSLYRWKGAVQDETEALLLIKSTADRFAQIAALLKQIHPYEVPELVCVPITDGLPAYLAWIGESLQR